MKHKNRIHKENSNNRPSSQIKPGIKKRRPSEAIRESAGDWLHANYWVKIGLTRNQLAALSILSKAYGFKKKDQPVASTARWLVMLALDSLPMLEARGRQMNRYADAEGFRTTVHLYDGRAKQVAAEIAADLQKTAQKG